MYAQNMMQQGVTEINAAAFAQAIEEKLKGKTLLMNEAYCNQTANGHLQDLKRKREEMQKAAGQKFLTENGKRKGVVTLPSGLQYEIMKEGSGAKPKATDQVTTHYHGTLIDGTVFDSSVERGQPATFPVSGVIKGWVEALQLMPVGSKWKLYVPSDLAYGARGAGGKIGPHTTLIFEVELLSIAGQ
jgi:FKBP-type peptidyl-prolyl cis-trans isomerase FklB